MMRIAIILFSVFFFVSCFLRKPYKVENFSFESKGNAYSVPLVVPTGYSKKWTSLDEDGNTILTYTYRNGAVFYLAHMIDTTSDMQPIVEQENIARQSHHTGALIYKGMDENLLWWREIRQKNFRMGYRFVNDKEEYRFDSATNYLVVWPVNSNAAGNTR